MIILFSGSRLDGAGTYNIRLLCCRATAHQAFFRRTLLDAAAPTALFASAAAQPAPHVLRLLAEDARAYEGASP